MTDVIAVTAEELRQFIERIEHINAEIKDLTDTRGEVFAEAKGRGYDCLLYTSDAADE